MFGSKLNTLPVWLLCGSFLVLPDSGLGQDFYSNILIPQTVYEKQPVTVGRWVDKTVMDKQKVTTYKPVWETETRQRRSVVRKPIHQTREREQRVVTYKPIVETSYREKRTIETTYETVTEYREEEYTVQKPFVETGFREERVTVRKPVTKQMIEVRSTTSYKPVTSPQTELVPAHIAVNHLYEAPDPARRARIQRLDAGYYTDPATGQMVYRRAGLHWVQPTTTVQSASAIPALVPQTNENVEFVPETVEVRKPVEITQYVEQVETRRVPYEIERMVEETATRSVPVEVTVPRTKVITEQVPYSTTRYEEEVVVKKVPYTETTYQEVETFEPYDVQVRRLIPETKEVEVPRIVRQRVEYEIMQDVPRTVWMKLPIDVCGNPIGNPTPVYQTPTSGRINTPLFEAPALETPGPWESEPTDNANPNVSSAYNSTLTRRAPTPDVPTGLIDPPMTRYTGKLTLVRPTDADEPTGENSVLVPETDPNEDPQTPLQKLDLSPDTSKPLDETSARKSKDATGLDADGGPGAEEPETGNAVDDGSADDPANVQAEGLLSSVAMPDNEPERTGDEGAAERMPKSNKTTLNEPK